MASNDKLLKKVEQERSKGQLDRALARLKEGIVENPRDFDIAREATELCFELGRTLEGAGILRAAMKRCPSGRATAIELLEREFANNHPLELGEILYESYLGQPDYDRARDVLTVLTDADRGKLLSKLRTKLTSVAEETPNDAGRLVALGLAEVLVLSSLLRSVEVAATLERILDLDAGQVAIVGRLAKIEMKQSALSGEVQLLLLRCYLLVDKPDLAADVGVAAGKRPEFRARALERLDRAPDVTPIRRSRAEVYLHDGNFEAARVLLESILRDDVENGAPAVRQTLETVTGCVKAAPALGVVYARALARTNAMRLAVKELQDAHAAGADAQAALAAVSEFFELDAKNPDIVMLRARLALEAHDPDVAPEAFQHMLEADPSRAESMRDELESAAGAGGDATAGRVLVDLYLRLEQPQEAADALKRLRDTHGATPQVLYDLSTEISGRFGLSAPLLLVFVESALDTEREPEARGAVAHYLGSPGARTTDFAQLLTQLVRERPALAPRLVRTLDGLGLAPEVRLTIALACLESDDCDSAVSALERLVLERPQLRDTALMALEGFLERHPEAASALILSAEFLDTADRSVDAVQRLATALRTSPQDTDRICKVAERVLRRSPGRDELWREIVLALVDAQRYRHARELCYLAGQVLPPEKQGFVHLALGEMTLVAGQFQAAVNELESALGCEDTPLDRLVSVLRKAVETDGRHGYVRYALAAALLRQGTDLDVAIANLSAAVQQDDLIIDLAFELLTDYTTVLDDHAPARVLEGLLFLRKGDRTQGIALLDRALQLQPELAAQVVVPLETEWDRDPQNAGVGLAFVRALRGSGQARRACRLAAELARRFPHCGDRLITELEGLLELESLPEAHRILWDLFLDRGEEDAAGRHLEAAVVLAARDIATCRELLELGLRRQPDAPWIACRLSETEARSGNARRAEELLRGLLVRDPSQADVVLQTLRGEDFGVRGPALQLLEIDCLLVGHSNTEALELLQKLRVQDGADRSALIERYQVLAAPGTAGIMVDVELGTLLKESGRIEEAVAAFEVALPRTETAPADESGAVRELRLALAQLYVELGRESEGRELLASVLDRPGDHHDTYGVLERLARQGMLSKLRSLRETISSYPGNLRARLELARLSIVSMDYEGAREALSFTGDSPAVEATRRYLLARSHADEDHIDLAAAVLRSISIDDVADDELRRNIVYQKAVCCEQLGHHGEAHTLYLHILSEFPYFKDTRERVRRTYQRHLESAVEPRAEALEKRTQLEMAERAAGRAPRG